MGEAITNSEPSLAQPAPVETTSRRALHLDVDAYLERLQHEDWILTDSQRAEVIQALWQILVPFAEMGFAIHPVQQICGQSEPEAEPTIIDAPGMVDSESGGVRSAFAGASTKGAA